MKLDSFAARLLLLLGARALELLDGSVQLLVLGHDPLGLGPAANLDMCIGIADSMAQRRRVVWLGGVGCGGVVWWGAVVWWGGARWWGVVVWWGGVGWGGALFHRMGFRGLGCG